MECEQLPANLCEISLVFVSDREIQKLNAKFRGKDKATDVLSFSQIEDQKIQSFDKVLGDIVISLDYAKRQAKEYKVTLDQELLRLIIHGLLHLVGYEHEGVSAKVAMLMFNKQDEVLEKFGQVKLIYK